MRPAREPEYPTKCLSVACTPASWRPRTYAVPTVPTRYGSSPTHSSTRPQRGSRTTSSTGARPWWTPSVRIDSPTSRAISSTRSGSNDAPHASGVGYVAACHAARPVRHSSCTIAGIPSRVPVRSRRCSAQSHAARSAGSTGRVPYTRV
ncbi:Uncharacterised protein [Mycobacteroides abscessus]|nr:Uncharacterised protein [Mycobacteroides abscessus]